MGFWTDLGNIAVGAIERDRENTAEKFKVRAEELKANRDLNIALRKDKYASELKAYEKEKEKANEIKRLNSEASGLSHESYAKRYLMNTMGIEKYKAYRDSDPEGFLDEINNFAEKVKNQGILGYQTTNDPDSLEAKFKADTVLINKDYSNAVRDAKTDSFLIKKLIGEKEKNISDVEKDINSSTEKTKVLTENINSDDKNVGLKLTVDGTKSLRKPPKEYQTEFSKVQGQVEFNSLNQKDNLFKFIDAAKTLDFSKEVNGFKFNDKDKKVTGLSDQGASFFSTYKSAYGDILKSYDVTELYNFASKNKGDIRNNMNTTKVHEQLNNLLLIRSDKYTTGKEGMGFAINKDIITMIPLKVVGLNNQYKIGNEVFTMDVDKSKDAYNKFLIDEANKVYGGGKKLSGNELNKAMRKIQSLVEGGNKRLATNLKKVLVPMEDTKTEVNKTDANVKTKTKEKSNFVVLPDGSAFSDGNKKYTFENIKKNNEQDKLPPNIKSAYDIWEQGQNKPDNVGTS